ncbi:MAG: hypothetical protein ACRDQ5_13780 [Sciscionella sp.]
MVTISIPTGGVPDATNKPNAATPATTPAVTTPTSATATLSAKSGFFPTGSDRIILTAEMLRMKHKPSPSPFTQRPTDPSKLCKIYEKATTGLKLEYGGEQTPLITLQIFAKSVARHLEQHGLMQEFLFADRKDGKVKNILQHYDCFSLEDIVYVTNSVDEEASLTNMNWSGLFLTNSITASQQLRLGKYHEYPTHGPVIWMQIVKENWSSSESALKALVTGLERLTLASIEGEHVPTLVTTIDNLCQRLDAANMLPREIITTLCRIFSTSTNNIFNTAFLQIRMSMDDPGSIKYTYTLLLEKATRLYNQLKDSDEWLPTTKTQRAFNATTSSSLTQFADSKTKGDKAVKCFKCGGPHYANKCPSKDSKRGSSGNQGQAKRGKDKHQSWKRTAPNSGSATQKTVDGQSYKWCGKCRRWTLTHGTEEHRGKPGQGQESAIFAEDEGSYAAASLLMAGF